MTATILRALPGLDGAIHANLPPVERVIDDDTWNATLDVSGHVNLALFFQTIGRPENAHLREAVRIITHNTTQLDLQASCVRELLANTSIRHALTLTLGPSQAEDLGAKLDDASREPDRCGNPNGECNNFLQDDPKSFDMASGVYLCPRCIAAVTDGD